MIIVMDNGGGSALFANGAPGGRGVAGLMGAPMETNRLAMANAGTIQPGRGSFGRGGPGMFGGTAGLFADTLLHEIIPMIDSTYRTIPNREHRGLAGLSMGGMQTRMIAMSHLDTFAYIGIFSGGNLGELTATNGPRRTRRNSIVWSERRLSAMAASKLALTISRATTMRCLRQASRI